MFQKENKNKAEKNKTDRTARRAAPVRAASAASSSPPGRPRRILDYRANRRFTESRDRKSVV